MFTRFLFKASLALLAASTLTLVIYTLLTQRQKQELLASYSYQGPTQAVPGNPKLVRIEVIVRDSPSAAGVQIQSVDLDGQGIPLQPRDIYGNRGTGSFQFPPGKYKLRWTVIRDRFLWPRTLNHEEVVTVDPRDLWLQIEIVGEEVSIR
jgi:hypothetical protein